MNFRSQVLYGFLMLGILFSVFSVRQFMQLGRTEPLPGDAIRIDAASRSTFSPLSSDSSPDRKSGRKALLARPVALPDEWEDPVPEKEIWYSFNISLQVPPDRLWGIFISQLQQNAEVYLNGQIAGSQGNFLPQPSRFINQPLYFPIPNGLIRPGENHFAIRVVSQPAGWGMLGRVFLGPDEILEPLARRQTLIRLNLPWFFTAGALIIGLVIGVLAWFRPDDKVYAWLSAMIVFWTLLAVTRLLNEPVVPEPWLTVLSSALSTGFCASTFFFIFRFIEIRPLTLERLILWTAGIGVLGSALAALIDPGWAYVAGLASNGVQMAIGPFVIYRLVRKFGETKNMEYFLILYAGGVVMIFGLPSVSAAAGVTGAEGTQYLFYTTPPLLATLVLLLVLRFLRALRASEQLMRDLDAKVQEKSRELEENHRRLARLERERAITEERERIMRDMHDGVGGHLVSTLHRLRDVDLPDAGIQETLENALTDLRLMIDSLDQTDGDLNVVLGMLRLRLEPMLTVAGIDIDWQAEELPQIDGLTPDSVLQILRIVQEAVTNVIKHSGAGLVVFRSGVVPEGIQVVVEDNGGGFDEGSAVAGRGLSNMRARADRIGAELTIRSSPSGTSLQLMLPAHLF